MSNEIFELLNPIDLVGLISGIVGIITGIIFFASYFMSEQNWKARIIHICYSVLLSGVVTVAVIFYLQVVQHRSFTNQADRILLSHCGQLPSIGDYKHFIRSTLILLSKHKNEIPRQVYEEIRARTEPMLAYNQTSSLDELLRVKNAADELKSFLRQYSSKNVSC
jgi:hypothetical protein